MPTYRCNRVQEKQDGRYFKYGITTDIRQFKVDGTIVEFLSPEPVQYPVKSETILEVADFTSVGADLLYEFYLNDDDLDKSMSIEFYGTGDSTSILIALKDIKLHFNKYPADIPVCIVKNMFIPLKKRVRKFYIHVPGHVNSSLGLQYFVIRIFHDVDSISYI